MLSLFAGNGLWVFIATVLLALACSIAFGLRVWARLLIRAWGTDDWLMLVGWALFMVQPAVTLFSRVGNHHSNKPADADRYLTDAQYETGRKWHFYIGILYTCNTTIVKCSICCLMLRFAQKKLHRWIFKGVIYVSVTACLIRIVAWLARCKQMNSNWKINADPHDCAAEAVLTNVSIFFSIICIITDFICAVLPVIIILKLQMKLLLKMCIVVVFSLGLAASVATILRVNFLFNYQDPHDFLFHLAPIAFYSNLEVALGIIAACVSTLHPLSRYLSCFRTEKACQANHRVDRRSYEAYQLRRFRARDRARFEEEDDLERFDSQAHILPQPLSGAPLTYPSENSIYMYRQ